MHRYAKQLLAAVIVILAPAGVANASISSENTAAPSLDRTAVRHLIRGITTELRESYVMQQEGEKAATALEKALAANAYDGITDPDAFAAKLTTQLRTLTGDSHVRVISGSPFRTPPASSAPETVGIFANRMDDGMGYLRLTRFAAPDAFKPAIDDGNAQAGRYRSDSDRYTG